jgi:hypothetical protein
MSANACICCVKTKALGCFTSCEDIDTTLDAALDGVYKIHIPFNGQVFVQELDLTNGDDIIIPGSALNEYYNYEGVKVYDPNGDLVKTPAPDDEDCFKFSIVPKITA